MIRKLLQLQHTYLHGSGSVDRLDVVPALEGQVAYGSALWRNRMRGVERGRGNRGGEGSTKMARRMGGYVRGGRRPWVWGWRGGVQMRTARTVLIIASPVGQKRRFRNSSNETPGDISTLIKIIPTSENNCRREVLRCLRSGYVVSRCWLPCRILLWNPSALSIRDIVAATLAK